MKANEYSEQVAGGRPRMVRYCVKHEQRLRVSEGELATYDRVLDDYPDMVSEDYDPYEYVCVEWGEREATWLDNVVDFMDRLERTDTPLLSMMGPKVTVGDTTDSVTWGWGVKDDEP